MKRTFLSALAILLVLALNVPMALADWDINNVDANFPVEEYIADETAKWNLGREVDLTWYFNYNHHYGTKAWSEYKALAIAAQITGIDVTGDIPTGDPTEKVNLMMATDSLPDMITLGLGDPLATALIEGGYVYCLEELLAEYEPEFWAELPDSLRQINTFDNIDGKMWGISGVTMPEWQFTNKYGLGGYVYNVRKDIWEDMGSPSIATPDELYNTLKLFRETYPTIDGKESIGIVGYEGIAGPLMTMGYSFGVYDMYVDEERGVCTVKYLNPAFADLIAYMNKLYREGLMDPEIFINDNQKSIEKMSTCAFCLPYVFWACDPASAVLKANDPNSVFVGIESMSATGEAYRAPSGLSRLGVVQTFVSKKCSDPQAAARLIAYGFSPAGSMQTSRGTPGINWWSVDGVWEPSQEQLDAAEVDSAAYNMEYGIWDYYSLWYQPMPGKVTENELRVNYDRYWSDLGAYDNTIEKYNMTPGGDSDEGIASTTIATIADRMIAQAITAATAEESAAIVADMVSQIQSTYGLDLLEAYMTAQYEKNLAKFGGPKF